MLVSKETLIIIINNNIKINVFKVDRNLNMAVKQVVLGKTYDTFWQMLQSIY
jgi:hypothetical protein